MGRGSVKPRPAAGFGGGTFLQPAPLQHGSAAVQHLFGRAAATRGPQAPQWGRGGCCAVRAGPRVGERRARAREVQGRGPGSGSGGWADSGLEAMG